MPVEMVDFGKFAQTAIAFQNLQETIRRNDLGAQGLTLEAGRLQAQREQNQLEQQRVNYQRGVKVLDELDKIEAEPGFQFNPHQRAQFLVTRGTILRNISGLKDLPIPENVDDAIGAGNAYTSLYKSIQSDDPKIRQDAMDQWAAENPKQFLLAAKTAKAEMELGEGLEQRRLLTQISAEKLDALKQKNSAYTVIDNVYGVNIAEMRAPLHVLQKPEMAKHFQKLQGMTDQGRDAYLAMYPEVAHELSALRTGYEDRARTRVSQLQQDFEARRQALEQAQTNAKDGQAAQQYVDEYQAHKLAVQARAAEHDWLSTRDNFFDPEKYKAVMRAEQDLRVAQGKPKAVLNGIQEERLAFQNLLRDDKNREADLKHKTGLAQALLQEEYSKARVANPAENENQSVATAISAVRKAFPGVPFDPSKLEDLSKKGKLDVGLKLGQEDQSRNYKAIEAAQGVLDYVSDLRERIQANPAIVGKGAQLGAAFSGAGQQLRAIAGMDPGASKFLNTKPRDEAEALHELLVYLQAKTMDPTGALDIKVVQHAREVVGDLSSFTTGPQQVLNKLDVAERAANRSMRRARQRLSGGPGAYLTDDTPNKPVSQMTEQELLKIIGGGLNP